MLYDLLSFLKAHKHKGLPVITLSINWHILIEAFFKLRTTFVLYPHHLLAGQFIFFYKGTLSRQPEGTC